MTRYKVYWMYPDVIDGGARYVVGWDYPTLEEAIIHADRLHETDPRCFCVMVDEITDGQKRPVYHKVFVERCSCDTEGDD